MFRKTLLSLKSHQSWLFIVLALISVLSACAPRSEPLEITSIKVFPESIVGQIVTLEITVESAEDGDNVEFFADTLEYGGNKVHLIGGDTNWQGSLTANYPQTFQMSVCVVEEGTWPVEFTVRSIGRDGWFDFERIHLESTLESGKLILSKDFTRDVEDFANRPTPRSFEVSIECSGKKEALIS